MVIRWLFNERPGAPEPTTQAALRSDMQEMLDSILLLCQRRQRQKVDAFIRLLLAENDRFWSDELRQARGETAQMKELHTELKRMFIDQFPREQGGAPAYEAIMALEAMPQRIAAAKERVRTGGPWF